MDFSFSEDQEELRALAARILGDHCTHERLKQMTASGEQVDRRLWKELASAGLLSVALPESCGGAGMGFVAAGILAEECGRAAAAVPYSASVVFAALPIARYADGPRAERWLAPLLSGEGFLSAALSEPGTDARHPFTVAKSDGNSWRLEGTKSNVPAGTLAELVVVSARTEDGEAGLFVVTPGAPGTRLVPEEATDGRPEAVLELDGVTVAGDDVLAAGPEGTAALEWLTERAQAALCLEIAGACAAALKLTAEYTSTRQQFGKPIATFQAVGQRAADAYIDTEAVRLTAWQAAWRLGEGLASAAEVAIAKYWADEGAQRVVHAAAHLHGGVGVDRDYPLHRYFLLVKHLALVLGGTTPSLLRLGELLADEPA